MTRGIAPALWLATLVALLALPSARGAEPKPPGAEALPGGERDERSIRSKLDDIIDPVRIEKAPAKDAFTWWSKTTGIPLVINWASLEQQGVDPQTPVTLDLRNVPASRLLGLIMQQASREPLIYERTEWYVQLTTRAEANKRMVTRVYAVGDLLHDTTPVGPPPSFDLNASISGNNTGGNSSNGTSRGTSGGGAAGGGGLFSNTTSSQTKQARSDTERSGDLTTLIRDTIEPDVWTENGGQASIQYYNGRLIVRAPLYVQEQIGTPEPTRGPPTVNPNYRAPQPPREVSNGVSAVHTIKPTEVGGRADR